MNRLLRRLRHAGYLLPATLTGYLWLKGFQPHLPGWSCPFLALTGVPCPGCFLTRATSAALTGRLQESCELHLFGPLTAVALVSWSVMAIRSKRFTPSGVSPASVVITASALFSYWLWRLWISYGIGHHGFPGFPAP